jgi:hypothetical protein
MIIVLLLFAWCPEARAQEADSSDERTSEAEDGVIAEKEFTLRSKRRGIVEVEVTETGTLEVEVRARGRARRLSLVLDGPGKDGYYARRVESAPVRISCEVNEEDVASGKKWQVTVINLDSSMAKLVVTVIFRSDSEDGSEISEKSVESG